VKPSKGPAAKGKIKKNIININIKSSSASASSKDHPPKRGTAAMFMKKIFLRNSLVAGSLQHDLNPKGSFWRKHYNWSKVADGDDADGDPILEAEAEALAVAAVPEAARKVLPQKVEMPAAGSDEAEVEDEEEDYVHIEVPRMLKLQHCIVASEHWGRMMRPANHSFLHRAKFIRHYLNEPFDVRCWWGPLHRAAKIVAGIVYQKADTGVCNL